MSESSDPMGTISCSNCKRDILRTNFVIHELHCQRYIYLCFKCNEPVNCKQKDAHDKANHVLVYCKNCHAQMEKFLLSGHLINDCPYRKLKCQICDIEVSATDIFEHENYCGSRTEKCLECGEYIMFKYKQIHIDSNHAFIKLSDEPGPSPSWQSGRRTLGNFLPDFESVNHKTRTHQKKKSGKIENRWRRGTGALECIEKGYKIAKESSSTGETNDGDIFQGGPDCMTEYRPEKQTMKKSFSNVAASQKVDSSNVNSVFSKDTRSHTEKGKMTPCGKDGTAPERVSRETLGSNQKTKFSNEIDNDKLIARAIEENAAVLSEFTLFDPSEKHKSLLGTSLSKNTYNGKTDKTVTKPRLYELDDSPDDEFLLYSKKTENELHYDGLPCQFCGSLYSSYTLMSHQQMCDLNKDLDLFPRNKFNKKRFGRDETEGAITCTICSQLVPFSRYSTHKIMHDMAAKN